MRRRMENVLKALKQPVRKSLTQKQSLHSGLETYKLGKKAQDCVQKSRKQTDE